jgi:hypothetical protein
MLAMRRTQWVKVKQQSKSRYCSQVRLKMDAERLLREVMTEAMTAAGCAFLSNIEHQSATPWWRHNSRRLASLSIR